MDFIAVAGLAVALIALLVATYGILDVRKQVRFLVTLERDRAYAKVLYGLVWRVVDPTEDTRRFLSSADMQEFATIVEALDPKWSFDSVLKYANNEILLLAKDLVDHGIAIWKPGIDENSVLEILIRWQNEKNASSLKRIFGKGHWPLSGPSKDLP